MAQRGGDLIKT